MAAVLSQALPPDEVVVIDRTVSGPGGGPDAESDSDSGAETSTAFDANTETSTYAETSTDAEAQTDLDSTSTSDRPGPRRQCRQCGRPTAPTPRPATPRGGSRHRGRCREHLRPRRRRRG